MHSLRSSKKKFLCDFSINIRVLSIEYPLIETCEIFIDRKLEKQELQNSYGNDFAVTTKRLQRLKIFFTAIKTRQRPKLN